MTNVLVIVFEIIFLFLIFGIIHTVLASKKIKLLFEEKAGDLIAFYRLGYNIISVLSFAAIYALMPRIGTNVYELNYPFDFIIIIPQLLALAGIFWSTKYFCVKEFFGISQIVRWMKGEYDKDDLDEEMTFIIDGPYKIIRHPLYFFFIIFLGCRPTMDLSYATLFLCISAYFYIGSFYEEKKLVEKFGDDYRKYREKVPRLFPVKSILSRNSVK